MCIPIGVELQDFTCKINNLVHEVNMRRQLKQSRGFSEPLDKRVFVKYTFPAEIQRNKVKNYSLFEIGNKRIKEIVYLEVCGGYIYPLSDYYIYTLYQVICKRGFRYF